MRTIGSVARRSCLRSPRPFAGRAFDGFRAGGAGADSGGRRSPQSRDWRRSLDSVGFVDGEVRQASVGGVGKRAAPFTPARWRVVHRLQHAGLRTVLDTTAAEREVTSTGTVLRGAVSPDGSRWNRRALLLAPRAGATAGCSGLPGSGVSPTGSTTTPPAETATGPETPPAVVRRLDGPTRVEIAATLEDGSGDPFLGVAESEPVGGADGRRNLFRRRRDDVALSALGDDDQVEERGLVVARGDAGERHPRLEPFYRGNDGGATGWGRRNSRFRPARPVGRRLLTARVD